MLRELGQHRYELAPSPLDHPRLFVIEESGFSILLGSDRAFPHRFPQGDAGIVNGRRRDIIATFGVVVVVLGF